MPTEIPLVKKTTMRRAILLASAERYISLPINIIATAVMARLFTPAEFGLTVLAGAIWAIAEPVRDFGVNTYLIQQRELTPQKTRTAFTLSFLATAIVIAIICLSSEWVAQFYNLPSLRTYLLITAISFAAGPFVTPIYALLRRDMAFGTLAFINLTTLAINLTTTMTLGVLGFSYMSFAYASIFSGAAGMALGLFFRPYFYIFKPSFAEWRDVAEYGVYDSAKNILNYLVETIPFLVFGRILGTEAVGYYQRALSVARMPAKVILAGLGPVVLPAFAQRIRDGQTLKQSYLGGVEYLTALMWPALLLLIVFAEPLVLLLLGRQWESIVPIVRIMAAAALTWFPVGLTNPTLMAVGAIRDAFVLALLTTPITIIAQSLAAPYGLHAIAMTMLVTDPFFIIVATYFVRRHIVISIGELARAMRKSAIVAVMSILGPLMIVAASDTLHFNLSIGPTLVGFLLFACGWFAGIWLTKHPLLHEIETALSILRPDRPRQRAMNTEAVPPTALETTKRD